MLDPSLLTELQFLCLSSIGRFKYLNAFQIARIAGVLPRSVNRAISYKRNGKKSLTEQGFLGFYDVQDLSGKGRKPRLYFLKKKGYDLLSEMTGKPLKRPIGTVTFVPHTYEHRAGLIDIQIALETYLEGLEMPLNFYDQDFDVIGSNRGGELRRMPKTKIFISQDAEDYIIPDFAFSYYKGEATPFFLGEFHRGKDTGRFMRQLWQHKRAIEEGSPTDKYIDLVGERNPRILCVFEQEGTRNAVARRVLEDVRFQDMHEFFLFATLDDVRGDISTAFKHLSDKPFSFLPSLSQP